MPKKQKNIIMLISFLFIISLLVQPLVVVADNNTITIKVDSLNVRSGPSLDYSIISSLNKDDKYTVIEEKNGWYKIVLGNSEGWVAGWLVEPTKSITTQSNIATIHADILNVRSGPSRDNPIIGKLYLGDKIEIIAVELGWYEIVYKGTNGWIVSEFANISTENQTQPTEITKQKLIVQPNILNLRSGPGLEYEIIEKLKKGDSLVTDISQGDWLHVTLESNSKINGWVANWFVTESDKNISNEPTVTILNPGTNLRGGPSTSHPVVAIANIGDRFPIIATEGDWYQILMTDGKKAYVAGWIVSTTGIERNIEHGMDGMLKNRTIVIDAGHGGNDYGATGINFNSIEKELNLSIALNLQKKLQATGAKVVMTRTTDTKVSLQQRVDSAIYSNADAFISIHHNTNIDYSLNGTITYYYKNSDKRLAQEIHKELIKHTKLTDLDARYGNYFILRENPKPSVLLELAFITNYQDELKVNSSKFQENAAEGIFQGLLKYFSAE